MLLGDEDCMGIRVTWGLGLLGDEGRFWNIEEMAVRLCRSTDLVGWLFCHVDEHTQHKLLDSLDALHARGKQEERRCSDACDAEVRCMWARSRSC